MPHRYTEDQKEFIREISPGRYNQEIADMFNARFGTEVTEGQIKCFKANHKIQSNIPKRRFTGDEGLFNKQQKDFIRANAKGLTNKELADLVNATFDLSVTARQMNTWKKNHDVISGLDFRFKKGSTPANKGKKGLYNVGGNMTSFKPGQRARNYKPVGTERIDNDGYTLVKVQDEGPWHKRWRHKHKVIWEKANGRPIPRGHAIIFGDRDKRNCDPKNLILVTKAQLQMLNNKKLIQHDAELTKVGIVIADLYKKIGERKKKSEVSI